MFSKKDLQRLIIPLIIEQFLAITIGMADTVMVSSCGEAAVSGVSLVDAINILLINIFSALATGGAIVSSQYIGREEPHKACEAAKQLVLAVLGLSLIVGAVCVFGGGQILSLIYRTIEPEVMDNAKIYFLLTAMSYPFIALYNAGAALFRAMGNSRISMVTSIFMNCINIAGNALFIFGFGMGAAGAALATLISRIIGAIFILALLRRPVNIIHIDSYLRLGFHPTMVKNILEIGIPNGMENGMFQLGKIIVQGMVASYGTSSIAANAICNSIAGFAIIPGSAIGLAMLTVVGQCVGARRYDEAKRYIFKLTGLAYLMMIVLNILILLVRDPIIGLFNLSAEAAGMASQIMFWHSIFTATLWPAAFTMPNGLRAANDVKFTMVVSVLSMWICRICMSYVLGTLLGLGVLGTWFAMFLDWVFRILFFAMRLHSNKWQHKSIAES